MSTLRFNYTNRHFNITVAAARQWRGVWGEGNIEIGREVVWKESVEAGEPWGSRFVFVNCFVDFFSCLGLPADPTSQLLQSRICYAPFFSIEGKNEAFNSNNIIITTIIILIIVVMVLLLMMMMMMARWWLRWCELWKKDDTKQSTKKYHERVKKRKNIQIFEEYKFKNGPLNCFGKFSCWTATL